MRTFAEHAAERGWPVFPCLPGGKEPAIPSAHPKGDSARGTCTGECGRDGHGFHDATTDPAVIRAWWRPRSARNVAIATGASNLVVIDLDPPAGRAQLERLGRLPATFTVSTVRDGGEHRYFAAIPGREFRNSTSAIAPNVDVRAVGGYVIAPGSRVGGRAYEITDGRLPAQLPGWLAELASTPPPVVPRPMARPSVSPGGYGGAALRGEAEVLAAAVPGTRNAQLNRSAFALGQLVAAGVLAENIVTEMLRQAARQNGLAADDGARRCEATIRSGLRAGMANPRRVSA